MQDFGTLDYPEGSINTYNICDESVWEIVFYTDISSKDPWDSYFSPWNIFALI